MTDENALNSLMELWRFPSDIWENIYRFLDASDVAQWQYTGDNRLRHLLTSVKRYHLIHERRHWRTASVLPSWLCPTSMVTVIHLTRFRTKTPLETRLDPFTLPRTLRILKVALQVPEVLLFLGAPEEEKEAIQKKVDDHFGVLEEYQWLDYHQILYGEFWALPRSLKRFETCAFGKDHFKIYAIPPQLEEYRVTIESSPLDKLPKTTLTTLSALLSPEDFVFLPTSLISISFYCTIPSSEETWLPLLPKSLTELSTSEKLFTAKCLPLLPPKLTKLAATMYYGEKLTVELAKLIPRSVTLLQNRHPQNPLEINIDALPFLPPRQLSIALPRTYKLQIGLVAQLPSTLTKLSCPGTCIPETDFILLPSTLSTLRLHSAHNQSAKGLTHLTSLQHLEICGGSLTRKGIRCFPRSITRLALYYVALSHTSALSELPPYLISFEYYGHRCDEVVAAATLYEHLPISLRTLSLKLLGAEKNLHGFSSVFSRLVNLVDLSIEGTHLAWPCTLPPKLQVLRIFLLMTANPSEILPTLPKTLIELNIRPARVHVSKSELRTALPRLAVFRGLNCQN